MLKCEHKGGWESLGVSDTQAGEHYVMIDRCKRCKKYRRTFINKKNMIDN